MPLYTLKALHNKVYNVFNASTFKSSFHCWKKYLIFAIRYYAEFLLKKKPAILQNIEV